MSTYHLIKLSEETLAKLGATPSTAREKIEALISGHVPAGAKAPQAVNPLISSPDMKNAKTVWDSNAGLRAEFMDDYAAFEAYHKNAVAGNVHDRDFTPTEKLQAAQSAQQIWDTDPGTRAEFGENFDLFKSFHEATTEGRVHGLKQ